MKPRPEYEATPSQNGRDAKENKRFETKGHPNALSLDWTLTGDTRQTKMNHNEATQLGAAEKYVLRELADEQREAFEDHFFNCRECNADVKEAMIFADTAREVFDEPEQSKLSKVEPQSSAAGWFDWFRRFAAVP